MASIAFGNQTYTGIELTPSEEALLERQVAAYLAEGDGYMAELYAMNIQNIKLAAQVAKYKLDAPFAGMLASDAEVGLQRIRPGHILRDTTTAETCINTWLSNSIESGAFVAGADYFIGFGSSNDEAANIDKEACVLLLGAEFSQGVSPVVEELLVQVGNITYPVIVLRDAWAADNKNRRRATRFHPILLEPKATVLGQVYSRAASSVQELRLLGVTFGYGRYLRKQTYSTPSL